MLLLGRLSDFVFIDFLPYGRETYSSQITASVTGTGPKQPLSFRSTHHTLLRLFLLHLRRCWFGRKEFCMPLATGLFADDNYVCIRDHRSRKCIYLLHY